MVYAQIKSGLKLHLVFERDSLQGMTLSQPICGIRANSYRMTCNMPLNHPCGRCQRVRRQRLQQKEPPR